MDTVKQADIAATNETITPPRPPLFKKFWFRRTLELLFYLGIYALAAYISTLLAEWLDLETIHVYLFLLFLTVVVAIWIARRSFVISRLKSYESAPWWGDAYQEVSLALVLTIFLGSVIFLTVDYFDEKQEEQEELDRLVAQVHSPVNSVAHEALRELRSSGLLITKTEQEEGDSRHWLHDIDLVSSNLSAGDLNNLDMALTDFSFAVLEGANLTEVDLSGATFSVVRLTGADFFHADLPNVTFENSELDRTNLRFANLADAELSYSNMKAVDFSDADFTGAVLMNVDATGALGQRVNFTETEFSWVTLDGASLQHALFNDAALTQSTLRGANLEKADLRGATLINVDLTDADLSFVTIDESTVIQNSVLPDGTVFNPETDKPLCETIEWFEEYGVICGASAPEESS